jgi:hypothetical protein
MTTREEAQKLAKIIKPYTVPFLYKYRSMNSPALEDVFRLRRIYLNDPTKFNDPFESRPVLTFHQSPLKRERFLKEITKLKFPNADKRTWKKRMKGKKTLLTDLGTLRDLYNAFVSSVGIYSLSQENADLLMWAHYSDSHRGLCLQFKASADKTLFWEAFKVTYQDDYPSVNIMDMGKAEEFKKALLTKSSHWVHEQEWRILKMETDGGPGYYEFSPELLAGIIFGALIEDDDKETVKRWIEGYPTKVHLYQARLNERKYQLDITNVP